MTEVIYTHKKTKEEVIAELEKILADAIESGQIEL